MSVTTLCAPGRRRSRVGFARTETPAIPSTAAATSTVTRRVETLRTAMRRTAFQPGPSAAPKPTAAGSAITSAALAAAASTTPAPCAAVGLSGVGVAVPTRTPFNAAASSPGRIWASTAAAPPASAAAALVAADRPVPGGAGRRSSPGSAVTSSTPAIATSGLTPPPKARPCDENGATRVSRSFARQPGAPSDDGDTQASGESRAHRCRDRRRQPDDRNVETVVETERSSRDEPVDEDRGCPGQHRIAAPRRWGRSRARAALRGRRRGCTRGCRSSARAELRVARLRRRDAASRHVSVSVVRGVAAPASGSSRSRRTPRPDRTTTRTVAVSRRRSAAPTVSAAGAPPGPPMLP